jgi:hypothetical protein
LQGFGPALVEGHALGDHCVALRVELFELQFQPLGFIVGGQGIGYFGRGGLQFGGQFADNERIFAFFVDAFGHGGREGKNSQRIFGTGDGNAGLRHKLVGGRRK